MCNRCEGVLQSDTPRDVYEGGVYHVYCGWKLRRQHAEQKAIRDINADKGETYADTLPPRNGSTPSVPEHGDTCRPANPEGNATGSPVPLHWTSHQ